MLTSTTETLNYSGSTEKAIEKYMKPLICLTCCLHLSTFTVDCHLSLLRTRNSDSILGYTHTELCGSVLTCEGGTGAD